jgi:TrpR-related protein YerC/YecD
VKDKTIRAKLIGELYDLILCLQTTEDCEKLFADLCTDKELEQMAQRVRAAKMLMNGKTYMEVIKETEISSATLSRVSRCVQYGEGYQTFIK